MIDRAGAIDAVDALAVDSECRAVGCRMRRCPAGGCSLKLVAVGIHHHPVDGGTRRRMKTGLSTLVLPRFQGFQMLLRHHGRVSRSRIAANLAGKARENADREHRPELVLAALAATEVGDLPQFIQKGRQGLRRGLHFGPLYLPVRIRLLRAEPGTGRRRQRVDKHLLRLPVRVGVAASAAGIALGTAHIGPVSGNIHRPLMPPGVNKRFGEFQRVPPPLVPVTAQPAQHSRHHATRQVRKLPGVCHYHTVDTGCVVWHT